MGEHDKDSQQRRVLTHKILNSTSVNFQVHSEPEILWKPRGMRNTATQESYESSVVPNS